MLKFLSCLALTSNETKRFFFNIEKENEGIPLHFIVTPNESVQLESGPVKCWVVNTLSSVLRLIFIQNYPLDLYCLEQVGCVIASLINSKQIS